MRRITLQLPDAFDALLRNHLRCKHFGDWAPDEFVDQWVTDEGARMFIALILAEIAERMDQPEAAAGLKQLNLEADGAGRPRVH